MSNAALFAEAIDAAITIARAYEAPHSDRKRGLTPRKPRRGRAARRPAIVPPAPDALPGQDALELFYLQPTLDSL